MCRVFIGQEPEVVALPRRRGLDVLQIDLQLVGDAFRTICQLSATGIEGMSHDRTCRGHAPSSNPTSMKEQEVGCQRAAQQSDEEEANQAVEKPSPLSCVCRWRCGGNHWR